jgi:hypothetical protein
VAGEIGETRHIRLGTRQGDARHRAMRGQARRAGECRASGGAGSDMTITGKPLPNRTLPLSSSKEKVFPSMSLG